MEATAPECAGWRSTAERLLRTDLFRCGSCHLMFRFPSPDAEELNRLYASIPAGRWDYDASEIGGWQAALKLMHDLGLPAERRILDVGCYDGKFLNLLPDEYQRFGIEPAESAIASLKQKDVHWVGKSLSDRSSVSDLDFHVITFFDVFEHLVRPREEIRMAASLLAKDGVLLVSTGNADHWTWKLLGSQHWYLHTLQHLCVGGETYFRSLAKDLNLRVRAIVRHPHHRASRVSRLQQSFESWQFDARSASGAAGLAARIVQRAPGFQHLIHRESGPYEPAIHDHILVALSR